MRVEPLYRYEELASFITGLVTDGTLLPGSRVRFSSSRLTARSNLLE